MVTTLPPTSYATMMDEWRSESIDRLAHNREPRTWAEYLAEHDPACQPRIKLAPARP